MKREKKWGGKREKIRERGWEGREKRGREERRERRRKEREGDEGERKEECEGDRLVSPQALPRTYEHQSF